jgi:hypothetical protein
LSSSFCHLIAHEIHRWFFESRCVVSFQVHA